MKEQRSTNRRLRAGDMNGGASLASPAHKALHRCGSRRIQHRYSRQVEDIGLRPVADAVQRGPDSGGGAEEESPRYAYDGHVWVGREPCFIRLAIIPADRLLRAAGRFSVRTAMEPTVSRSRIGGCGEGARAAWPDIEAFPFHYCIWMTQIT